jgi:heme exporter protein D
MKRPIVFAFAVAFALLCLSAGSADAALFPRRALLRSQAQLNRSQARLNNAQARALNRQLRSAKFVTVFDPVSGKFVQLRVK